MGDRRYFEENVSKGQRRVTRWTLCEVTFVSAPPHSIAEGCSVDGRWEKLVSPAWRLLEELPAGDQPEVKPKRMSKKKAAALAGDTLFDERGSAGRPKKVGKYDYSGTGDGG